MAAQRLVAGLPRYGVVVLDSDLSLEPELAGFFQGEVGIHVSRVRYSGGVTTKALQEAHDGLVAAMHALASIDPALIVYACTSGTFFRGPAGNKAIERMMRKTSGRRGVTASSAVVRGLQRLGARRVGVVSPYPSDIGQRLREFLTASGFTVARTYELFDGRLVDDVELQSVAYPAFERACLAVRDGVDAILVSCTGMRMIRYIEALESMAGVPVISSNAAIARVILDESGLSRPNSAGTLLALSPEPVGSKEHHG